MKIIYLFFIFFLYSKCLFGNFKFKQDSSIHLFVSKIGNDSWSGYLNKPNFKKNDGPFLTIEKAINTVKEIRGNCGLSKLKIIVSVGEGVYNIKKPILLEEINSNLHSNCKIIIKGVNRNTVHIVSGKNLNYWQSLDDKSVFKFILPNVRNKILQTNISNLGISDYGSPKVGGTELYFNYQPMQLARDPNVGNLKIGKVVNENPIVRNGERGDLTGKFSYNDLIINDWVKEKDAWVSGYWFYDWSQENQKIKSIDSINKIMELDKPYHNYGYKNNQGFYGYNLLSKLDSPGEYYINREKGILYFYPPTSTDNSVSYLSEGNKIFQFTNFSNFELQSLTIEGSRDLGIYIENSKNIIIQDCVIRNMGGWAVHIDGGNDNQVLDCDIFNIGAGGIYINSGGRNTLIAANNIVDNNYIHDIARLKRTMNPAISLNGVGNKASHNRISHLPHNAIYFSGNDQVVEYNEIFDVTYESNDAGAIYAGRSWTMRGSIIRYNYLHDINGLDGKGCVGIYLDDMFSSATVYGNIFKNISRAVMIGGGRDNSIKNNIFINCNPSLHIDARGLGFGGELANKWIKEGIEKDTITGWDNIGIAFNKPPFSQRYPELKKILLDEPKAPKGNIISNNVCIGGSWDKPVGFWHISVEAIARPLLKMENNLISSSSKTENENDPSIIKSNIIFENSSSPEKKLFQLQKKSPAIAQGFKQIPFALIGLYKNTFRKEIYK